MAAHTVEAEAKQQNKPTCPKYLSACLLHQLLFLSLACLECPSFLF